jgi:hypothetical protein
MDMQYRQNQMVLVVLQFGQLLLEQPHMVVVDHRQRSDNVAGGPARGFAHEFGPDQIAECLGSIGVSPFVDEGIKLVEKVGGNGHADAP